MPSAEETAAAFELCTEVKSCIRGLVVAYILHDERVAVYGFCEERVEAVFSRDGGDVETQVAVVLRARQHLFAPVAKDICTKGWIGLGAVVEGAVGELGQLYDGGRAGEIERHRTTPDSSRCGLGKLRGVILFRTGGIPSLMGGGRGWSIFTYRLMIEQLPTQISIPPDTEVNRDAGDAIDDLATNVANAA